MKRSAPASLARSVRGREREEEGERERGEGVWEGERERERRERGRESVEAVYTQLRRPWPEQPRGSVVLTELPTSWSKKVLWFCWKLAQMKFRTNKFAELWNIWDFFWKSWKNPISSLKFGQISNLKSQNFQLFQKKSRIFQN